LIDKQKGTLSIDNISIDVVKD